MPVVPALVEGLEPERLVVRWGKGAPVQDVEGFLTHLLTLDGLGEARLGLLSPSLDAELEEGACSLLPGADLWSMCLAEEMAIRLARAQAGEISDGQGNVLATAETEESQPWLPLEAVGVPSLFRPRPADAPDLYSHPLIPLDDCKIAGIGFNQDLDCVLGLYFDYGARPCAFLTEDGEEPVLLYRPMYRYRQAILGIDEVLRITVKGPPESRVYGALDATGYKVDGQRVGKDGIWTFKAQEGAFQLRIRIADAYLTRAIPLWKSIDDLLLSIPTTRSWALEELISRKEQHWDIVDSVWEQDWFVPAHPDGTLNPYGRIYKAELIVPLLDMPRLRPKE
jgi:hypothetical protein